MRLKAIDFVAEKDRDRAMQFTKNIFKQGGGGTLEYTLRQKDGKEVEAEFSVTVLKDRNGNPIGFIGASMLLLGLYGLGVLAPSFIIIGILILNNYNFSL
jgi:PAS domain-containing protein